MNTLVNDFISARKRGPVVIIEKNLTTQVASDWECIAFRFVIEFPSHFNYNVQI